MLRLLFSVTVTMCNCRAGVWAGCVPGSDPVEVEPVGEEVCAGRVRDLHGLAAGFQCIRSDLPGTVFLALVFLFWLKQKHCVQIFFPYYIAKKPERPKTAFPYYFSSWAKFRQTLPAKKLSIPLYRLG